jgi:transcriptional regulator with XRE-family HTH domain
MHVPRLRDQRERRALTQEELATLARLSRATIMALEAGRNAQPKTVRKLAAALHIKPTDLK